MLLTYFVIQILCLAAINSILIINCVLILQKDNLMGIKLICWSWYMVSASDDTSAIGQTHLIRIKCLVRKHIHLKALFTLTFGTEAVKNISFLRTEILWKQYDTDKEAGRHTNSSTKITHSHHSKYLLILHLSPRFTNVFQQENFLLGLRTKQVLAWIQSISVSWL